MIRSSSLHRICTNRPFFNEADLATAVSDLKSSKYFEKNPFNMGEIGVYCDTKGIATKAKTVQKLINDKSIAKIDPLPDGAKSYLQELWLENNYHFYNFSLRELDPALIKGNLMEDEAISITSKLYKIKYQKNEDRITIGFLTGECDVIYREGNTIRDNKCPETWISFRKKDKIESAYRWQLIGYSLLYRLKAPMHLFIDYVLIENPEEVTDIVTRGMTEDEVEKYHLQEKSIKNLPLKHKVKTFEYEWDIIEDQKFAISRIIKAEQYYKSLNYETCMNLITK